ncbi:hypothetical protein CHUAL_004495 [Chamberlinius hualienensis]
MVEDNTRRVVRTLSTDSDVPNEAANTVDYRLDISSGTYTELQSEGPMTSEELRKRWEMNYHEATIFLEEGENNEKFNSHPKDRDALPLYLLVHNPWFYTLDLLASLILLSLASFERPAATLFALPIWVHASIELLGLFVVGIESFLKLRWQGWRTCVNHARTMIKAATLIIMFIEVVIVLIRQSSHFRVTRALRPIFLIDNHYCGGVRRFIRQILQSLPPILDMLGLLLFFMLIFSILGFYFFSSNPSDPYFKTLQDSFVNLFVLLTTANFPDVMMPAYAKSIWVVPFFVLYLSIVLYFFMNLMLAVVYHAFTEIEKDKFRKLLLHKRRACQHAFKLLVNRKSPFKMGFKHFEGFLKFYKPKKGHRDVYLVFKALNKSGTGFLTLDEFYPVYEFASVRWKVVKADLPWFHYITNPMKFVLKWNYKMVTSKWFAAIIYLIVVVNGIWLLLETGQISNNLPVPINGLFTTHWYHLLFVIVYAIEAFLKILGIGFDDYFSSGWNVFDFMVMLISAAGIVGEYFGIPFFYVVALRPLSLLSVFQMKRRYRDVFGTLFILLPRLISTSIVVIILYYFFAVIGMELFASYDLRNCCKNTSVESFFNFNVSGSLDGYYYLNNFNNMFRAGVTLFELTVVNNWFIIMEGFTAVTTPWSRIYFMVFYIVMMVVLTITVAFILEAFLFRSQYQTKSDIDDDKNFTVKVMLSREELHFCYNRVNSTDELASYTRDLNIPDRITYIGKMPRTKHTLSMKMYEEEVKEWLAKAESEERHRAQLRSVLDVSLPRTSEELQTVAAYHTQ